MDLQASWLFRGYFEVADPSGGPSITQQVRDSLATRLSLPAGSLRIASYPVGPAWRNTFWWREGESDYAEAQFFAQIAQEYPVLSVGVSVEKGLVDPAAVPAAKRATYLMDRKTWDWQRLRQRAKDVLSEDIPACASRVSRPLQLRFHTHRYVRGKSTTPERRAFVFREGAWSERHVGRATEQTIVAHVRELDKRDDWWVNAYVGCDLFPGEVEGMKPETLADLLSSFSAIRKRIRATGTSSRGSSSGPSRTTQAEAARR